MAEMTSEKMAAQEEAAGRTDWERQTARLLSESSI